MKTQIVVALVYTLAGSAAAQSTRQFTVREEMRISGAKESFASFYTYLIDRNGRIVIPQSDDGAFRFYDSNGKSIGTFGRKGDGPGEFADVTSAMGWRADTLWIFDFNSRRITFVGPDLKLIRTQSTVAAAATASPAVNPERRVEMTNANIVSVFADGTFLMRSAFGPTDPDSRMPSDWRFVNVDVKGDIIRQIVSLPPMAGRVYAPLGGGMASTGVPFASSPQIAISSDGRRFGIVPAATFTRTEGSFNVTVIHANGDTLFSRAYKFAPIRIPQTAKDSALSAIATQTRSRVPTTPPIGQQLADKARPLIPAAYAPVLSLTLGEDDTTWLGVFEPGSNARYRGLDAKGNVIGEFTLPASVRVVRVSRTQLWTIEYDADGVPSVIRSGIRG